MLGPLHAYRDALRLARSADQAARSGDGLAAFRLRKRAAILMDAALHALPPEAGPRGRGRMAVRTAALWRDAGDWEQAERTARRLLTDPSLPPCAQERLRAMLRDLTEG